MADRSSIGTTCDTSHLKELETTREALRFKDICRVKMVNASNTSDSYGMVEIANWTLANGPQGVYSVYYSTEGGVRTKTNKMFFRSPVASLVSKNTPPTSVQHYGVPLTVQPKVKVLDLKGNPVANKTVIATSWPEPYVKSPKGLAYEIDGSFSSDA